MSIALMAVTYLLLAYATVTGFDYNGTALDRRRRSRSSAWPTTSAGWLAFIAYLAGLTSTLGVLIAAVELAVPG